MRVCRNIDYERAGITEENGWKVSYNWNSLRKTFRVIETAILVPAIVIALIFRKSFVEYGILKTLLGCGCAILFWLIILTPIHEILHFLPYPGALSGRKCYIVLSKAAVSAFYNGKVTQRQLRASLLTPFIILSVLNVSAIVFLSGAYQLWSIYLLFLNCFSCYSDIYMFFYIGKHFSTDTVFYGNRYFAK